MEKIINDIFRSVRAGFVSMTSKANELAQVGRLKIDVVTIRHNIDKLFLELGERVYHLSTVEKQPHLATDPTVQSIISRIYELQDQLKEKKQLAHDIFYNEVLGEAEPTPATTTAPPSPSAPTAAATTVSATMTTAAKPAEATFDEPTPSPAAQTQTQNANAGRMPDKNSEPDFEAEAAGDGFA